MLKYIKNAEGASAKEEELQEIIDTLKDNFACAVDGIEKIAADGDVGTAIDKATTLNQMIDGSIGEIAEDIAE